MTPQLPTDVIASSEDIKMMIKQLASRIIREHKNDNPLFICLLRGGVPFASQLMFAITDQDPYFHPELDYMTVSSYGSGQIASAPRIAMDISPKTIIKNRTVIVLDDMIDKGGTYAFTKELLEKRNVKSVQLAVLIQRKVKERTFDADFYCLEVDTDAWLTGMGLDDSRVGVDGNRWMRYIAAANES